MRASIRILLAVLCVAAASSWWVPAAPAADTGAAGLIAALGKLDDQIHGKKTLTASERTSVHGAKAALIATYYAKAASGSATYADVLTGLDCVDTSLQRARNGTSTPARRSLAAKARRCQRALLAKLATAPKQALTDLATMGKRIDEIAAAIRRGKVFGAKSTTIRRLAASFAKRHFDKAPIGDVSFSEAFADLECVDVKVEAGRVSGASSCARRLARLLEEKLPPPEPITWGSALAGDPLAIGGRYDEDTEFWTKGVTAPVAGTITQFRLKVGAGPVDLPLRFSVVRPQPDGQVKVVTTTDPPYALPANKPGTYEFNTSALRFKCCKVQAGDIVTVNNGGNPAPDAYVWFASNPGFTTFLHTGAPNMDFGMLWTGTPHAGYEVLLQVIEQPSG